MKVKLLKEYVSPTTGTVSKVGEVIDVTQVIAEDLIASAAARELTSKEEGEPAKFAVPREEPVQRLGDDLPPRFGRKTGETVIAESLDDDPNKAWSPEDKLIKEEPEETEEPEVKVTKTWKPEEPEEPKPPKAW